MYYWVVPLDFFFFLSNDFFIAIIKHISLFTENTFILLAF